MILSQGGVRRGLGRALVLGSLVACLFGAAGWLLGSETPAAQRLTETIKPYDPLQ